MGRLRPQLTNDVHVLLLTDKGEQPVGLKRQLLLESATAEWVSFVDDDDLIPADYCRRIGRVIFGEDPPDVVGFRLRYFEDGVRCGEAVHSYRATDHPTPETDAKGWKRFDRLPNHLNPVRRSMALRATFQERKPDGRVEYLRTGEDGAYAVRLARLTPREFFLDAPMYDYLDRPRKTFQHWKT